MGRARTSLRASWRMPRGPERPSRSLPCHAEATNACVTARPGICVEHVRIQHDRRYGAPRTRPERHESGHLDPRARAPLEALDGAAVCPGHRGGDVTALVPTRDSYALR